MANTTKERKIKKIPPSPTVRVLAIHLNGLIEANNMLNEVVKTLRETVKAQGEEIDKLNGVKNKSTTKKSS